MITLMLCHRRYGFITILPLTLSQVLKVSVNIQLCMIKDLQIESWSNNLLMKRIIVNPQMKL